MKNITILILFSITLSALNLTVNSSKENNQSFSIIHLIDDIPFLCKKEVENFTHEVLICQIDKYSKKRYKQRKTKYFTIDFYQNQKGFFLKIDPLHNFSFYPIKDKIAFTKDVQITNKSKYDHWIIVGYDEKLDLLKENEDIGLDFPITYTRLEFPSIGALNVNGEPIEDGSTEDVNDYLEIKKLFDDKKYYIMIDKCDSIIDHSPNNIFKSELLLYKMRALDKISMDTDEGKSKNSKLAPETIVEIGQEWIIDNPSNEHLPEVLMLLSKTYLNIGLRGKADYYLDILTKEHSDDKFTKMGVIYLADKIYALQDKEQAKKLYEEVLYSTDDITAATIAALRLGDKYFQEANLKKGIEFYQKAIDGNMKYILKDINSAYRLANKLADNGEYALAIKIADEIVKNKKSQKDIYENALKNSAYWREKIDQNSEAIELYKMYLKEFKFGEFVDFAKERIDKLLFKIEDSNATRELQHLNHLIENYEGDPIKDKAIVQKAKLLLKHDKYRDVLQMKDELKNLADKEVDANQTLHDAARLHVMESLNSDDCFKAITLIKEYNVELPSSIDGTVFNCYLRRSRYSNALKISTPYLKNDDLNTRIEWMYKTLKIYSKRNENTKIVTLSNDIEKLSKILKTDKYDDIVYYKIEAYYHLKFYDNLLQEIKRAETIFPNDIRNIEAFEKIVNMAQKKNDDLLVVNYAKKIIELQKLHKIELLTPKIYFTYIESLKKLNKNEEALTVALKLLYKPLKEYQRARVLYYGGELSIKIGKEKDAKEFFNKCVDIIEDTSWKNLCQENIKLLEK